MSELKEINLKIEIAKAKLNACNESTINTRKLDIAMLEAEIEVLERVLANGLSTTTEQALNIDSVAKRYSSKDMDDAYDKGYTDGVNKANPID